MDFAETYNTNKSAINNFEVNGNFWKTLSFKQIGKFKGKPVYELTVETGFIKFIKNKLKLLWHMKSLSERSLIKWNDEFKNAVNAVSVMANSGSHNSTAASSVSSERPNNTDEKPMDSTKNIKKLEGHFSNCMDVWKAIVDRNSQYQCRDVDTDDKKMTSFYKAFGKAFFDAGNKQSLKKSFESHNLSIIKKGKEYLSSKDVDHHRYHACQLALTNPKSYNENYKMYSKESRISGEKNCRYEEAIDKKALAKNLIDGSKQYGFLNKVWGAAPGMIAASVADLSTVISSQSESHYLINDETAGYLARLESFFESLIDDPQAITPDYENGDDFVVVDNPKELKNIISNIKKEVENKVNSITQNIDVNMLDGYNLNAMNSLSERNRLGQLDEQDLKNILACQKALLEIKLTSGRNFHNGFFLNSPWVNMEFRERFSKILFISRLSNQQVHEAKLAEMRDQHDRAQNHPIVAILGTGPVGLMAALTQYESGGKVHLFANDKPISDQEPCQHQLIHLDSQWVSMLQHYLGCEFYDLFNKAGGMGRIREEDGHGEIAAHALRDALYNRVKSLSETTESLILHPHEEITQLNTPKTGKKLVIQTESRNTASSNANFAVDVYIDAQHDFLKLKDKKSKATMQHYAEASWVGETIKNVLTNKIGDSDGLLALNDEFLSSYHNKLLSIFAEYSSTISPEHKNKIVDALQNIREQLSACRDNNEKLRVQVMDNKHVVYLQAEIPQAIQWLHNLTNTDETKELQQRFDSALFEIIAEKFNRRERFGVWPAQLQTNSIQFFQYSKESNEEKLKGLKTDSYYAKKGSTLNFNVADYSINPNVSSTSELAKAREQLLNLQSFMQANNHNTSDGAEDAFIKRTEEIFQSGKAHKAASDTLSSVKASLKSWFTKPLAFK